MKTVIGTMLVLGVVYVGGLVGQHLRPSIKRPLTSTIPTLTTPQAPQSPLGPGVGGKWLICTDPVNHLYSAQAVIRLGSAFPNVGYQGVSPQKNTGCAVLSHIVTRADGSMIWTTAQYDTKAQADAAIASGEFDWQRM